MINRIIDGILAAIDTEFNAVPSTYHLYTEDVKQGLKEPCFFIKIVRPAHRQVVGRRYRDNHTFVVRYFPATDDWRSEAHLVIERLGWCLKLIPDGDGFIRGADMHAEIVDGVLNFMVDYNVITEVQNRQTLMATQKMNSEVN